MPSDLISKVSQRSLALAVLFLLGYIGVWTLLAFPFSPFPSDETSSVYDFLARNRPLDEQNILYYWLTLIVGQEHPGLNAIAEGYRLSNILSYHSPGYYLILYIGESLCSSLTPGATACRVENVLLFAAIASNAVIVGLTGLVAYELTRSVYAQSAAHAIYAFSAWPVTYHYMTSDVVTMTACVMLALWLAMVAMRDETPRTWPSGLSGAVTGLALWVSSSAPLVVALLCCVIILSFGRWTPSFQISAMRRSPHTVFLLSFIVVTSLLASFGMGRYLDHLMENINSEHLDNAALALGSVPSLPLFTYVRILGVYGEVTAVLTLFGMLIVAVTLIARVDVGIDRQRRKFLAGMLFIVVAHAILIDLLPTTKLARSQFAIYPLTVVVMCLAGYILFQGLFRRTGRAPAAGILMVAVAVIVYEGTTQAAETVRVKTSLVKRVAELRQATTDLYVLCDDPHYPVLLTTLNWNKPDSEWVRVVNLDELVDRVSLARGKREIGLIIGPHGAGSGRSVAHHSSLPDFNLAEIPGFDYVAALSSGKEEFPYYMYYPPFLLEEEVSQALYFAGLSPDYRRDSAKNLTLLQF